MYSLVFSSLLVVIDQAVIEDPPVPLIPVALDNLPPQHSAIFLFGCQVMRLLGESPLFPPVLLLLAKSLPASPASAAAGAAAGGLLAHCSGDFYFDTANQILYLSEATLQHVGQFIATILQSMAYVASGESEIKEERNCETHIQSLRMTAPPPPPPPPGMSSL